MHFEQQLLGNTMALRIFSFPLLSYPTHEHLPTQRKLNSTPKPFQTCCSDAKLNSNASLNRKSACYQPTLWTNDFVQSLKISPLNEVYEDKVKMLEEKVRGMLNSETNVNWLSVLETIDDIQRLGLGNRFREDIKTTLDRFSSSNISVAMEGKSLHAIALSFRLLRQHGYSTSSDMFKLFLDQEGSLKTYLLKDAKGLLSLYEASHLAFEEEPAMDEVQDFARTQLIDIKRNLDKTLVERVSHELELPLHHRTPRLEARWYIERYRLREEKNQALLELALLNFNMEQSNLQRDLKDLSRWWKDTGLAEKLSFARDRLMECFFWAIGMVSQPELRGCRRGLTKVAAFITIIDDIYDVHGSMDELELFTEAVERWDVNALGKLPDYMKLCFLALYNTVNGMAYYPLKEQRENAIPYLAKVWSDMCKAFLQEARWNKGKCRPTFEDYLENAWVSVSGVVLLIHAYFLANQNITSQALESLEKCHDLLRWPSVIFRLCNDLGTSSAELERGENVNSISCYMHDTGLSEEAARHKLRELIDEAWKKMNKQHFENSPFEKPFIEIAKNLARISHCTYQYGDGHGAPDVRSKKRVLALIIDPISLVLSEPEPNI